MSYNKYYYQYMHTYHNIVNAYYLKFIFFFFNRSNSKKEIKECHRSQPCIRHKLTTYLILIIVINFFYILSYQSSIKIWRILTFMLTFTRSIYNMYMLHIANEMNGNISVIMWRYNIQTLSVHIKWNEWMKAIYNHCVCSHEMNEWKSYTIIIYVHMKWMNESISHNV